MSGDFKNQKGLRGLNSLDSGKKATRQIKWTQGLELQPLKGKMLAIPVYTVLVTSLTTLGLYTNWSLATKVYLGQWVNVAYPG